MNKAHLIKRELEKAGRCVYIKDNEWISTPIRATISHLWRKKTSSFEPKYTELGLSKADYYLYVGPYNHDITALSRDAVLVADDELYEFKCADAVNFGDEIIYYTGILKRLSGADLSEN